MMHWAIKGAMTLALGCLSMRAMAQASSDWSYEYLPGAVTVPCMDDEAAQCRWHRLVVENRSEQTLECSSRIDYDAPNRDQVTVVERRTALAPKTRRAALADSTSPEVQVKQHHVNCTIRPPLDDSKLTPNCKINLSKRPESIDYPAESRRASEEGPVLLEFSLTNKEAAPMEIVVVGSSLSPRLDAAAVKYASQHLGSTDCKKGRFRMPITFRLK